jgi:hypothetical protein
MLLYPNERLWPLIFAVVLSIGSESHFARARGQRPYAAIFNPQIRCRRHASPVSRRQLRAAIPFTENITGLWDWAVPLIVLITGIIVHALFTGRLPLVGAWICGFVLQAVVRAKIFGTPFFVPLMR